MELRRVAIAAVALGSTLFVACGGAASPAPPPTSKLPATAAPDIQATQRILTNAPPPATPAGPASTPSSNDAAQPTLRSYPVPKGSAPHDVAPAKDGGGWYTAQG